jgi:hypothetical protein
MLSHFAYQKRKHAKHKNIMISTYTPAYVNRQLTYFNDESKTKSFRDDALFRLASHLDIDLDPDNYTELEKQQVLSRAEEILK